MSEVTRYPFDPDVYQVGQVMTAYEIERVYGVLRTDPKFGLVALNARQILEGSFRKRGIEATIRSRNHDLEICAAEQAASYTVRRRKSAGRLLRKTHRQMCSIDVSQLPSEVDRLSLTMEIVRTGKIVQYIGRANRMPASQLLELGSKMSVKSLTAGKPKP